ncbi:MAG: helix-turn-helix domain-containing protein [Sphingobacteriales bacterium JAD_PAG50586_3]|nr:MAG: helix-turn-helix domain-containing protein [Sphingobacteriales bacterium JAD_PAG50586_3]
MDVIVIESNAFKEIMSRLQGMEKAITSILCEPKERIIDNDEFIAEMKISRRTAQTWRDEGLINFYQIDRKIYYKQTDIDTFLEKHRINGFHR